MTEPETKTLTPKDREAWRAWLERHHATESRVWVVYPKKNSRRRGVTYDEAVEEALCFGWIDSKVRSIDDERLQQLFSRRKRGSTWARSNKERVARLVRQGRMTDAGMAAVERAKEDGSWTVLEEIDALEMPADLAEALAADEMAARNFDAFSPSIKKGFLWWVRSAKREQTRAKRIAETVRLAAENRTPWQGSG